jgi:hypothetical protein
MQLDPSGMPMRSATNPFSIEPYEIVPLSFWFRQAMFPTLHLLSSTAGSKSRTDTD